MKPAVLRKHLSSRGPAPNLGDYAATRAGFSWALARSELDGLPGGGLNIAHEALDRHLARRRGDKLALRWLGKDGTVRDFTYDDLVRRTNRFANVLQAAGIGKGDTVFTLLGRVPELYISALGTLKNGSVVSPLFSVFGPEPVQTRMQRGEAKALVTTRHLYERKVAPWRAQLPSLRRVFLIDGTEGSLPADTASLPAALAAAHDRFDRVGAERVADGGTRVDVAPWVLGWTRKSPRPVEPSAPPRTALEAFAQRVAAEVVDQGAPQALEAMSAADRKIVHDTVTTIEGVHTSSEGVEPNRYVVIHPGAPGSVASDADDA